MAVEVLLSDCFLLVGEEGWGECCGSAWGGGGGRRAAALSAGWGMHEVPSSSPAPQQGLSVGCGCCLMQLVFIDQDDLNRFHLCTLALLQFRPLNTQEASKITKILLIRS